MTQTDRNNLINELISDSTSTTEERMKEIRKQLLDYIFTFGDSSVFEELVFWDDHFHARILHNERNLEIPGNKTEIIHISTIINKLENSKT